MPLAVSHPPADRPPRNAERGWLHLASLDIGPLRRHREFRLLFIGRLVSTFGNMITFVAVPYQVYQLTHSVFVVGMLGLAELAALIGFAMLGGALADAADRRKMVLLSEAGLMAGSILLAGNSLLTHPLVWLIFVDAARPSIRRVVEGIRYARSRPELIGTYVVDTVAMLFGMPMALFPAIAQGLGGPKVLGLLYAAPAVGSFLFAATSGWTGRVHRHGMGVIVAATLWGAAIIF